GPAQGRHPDRRADDLRGLPRPAPARQGAPGDHRRRHEGHPDPLGSGVRAHVRVGPQGGAERWPRREVLAPLLLVVLAGLDGRQVFRRGARVPDVDRVRAGVLVLASPAPGTAPLAAPRALLARGLSRWLGRIGPARPRLLRDRIPGRQPRLRSRLRAPGSWGLWHRYLRPLWAHRKRPRATGLRHGRPAPGYFAGRLLGRLPGRVAGDLWSA